MSKRNILVLVEGEKADCSFMERLFTTYGISERHQLYPYRTNLYALYNAVFKNKDIDDIDIFLHLREHADESLKETIFDQRQRYTDIILMFDFDPQDRDFSADSIREMAEYFTDSTDMGKLYINYPMLEAFYHIKSIPDPCYGSYCATLEELKAHDYKSRVTIESVVSNRKEFVSDKSNCNLIIRQNLEKAWQILEKPNPISENSILPPEQTDILSAQLELLSRENTVSVLNTSAFYIVDYNPELVALKNTSGGV